jgi:hypothetical protein
MSPRIERNLQYFKDRTTVDPQTGCWLWQLRLGTGGYGEMRDANGRTQKTHRGAWRAVNGAIPAGLCICHRCDVRRCCNPDHLFVGTHQDNADDRGAKGRTKPPKGEGHGMSKLKDDDVRTIRALLGRGVKGAKLATLFKVSQATISHIKHGQKWAHVQGAPS